jgi:hypothetical protein
VRILGIVAALLTVLMTLAGCATTHAKKAGPADSYSFRHKNFDLKYAWNLRQSEQGLHVDGLIKNIRFANMGDIGIDVTLLDKARKVVAEGSTFTSPQHIQIDDDSSFGLLLKNAKVSEGDQLRFHVSYNASEGPNAVAWSSDFTVYAATGKTVGVGEKSVDEW